MKISVRVDGAGGIFYQPGGLDLRLTSTKTCRRILLIRFLLSTALKWRSPLWLMSGIPTQLRINKMNLKYHPQECCASALFSWLLFEIDAFIHHAAAAIESPDLIQASASLQSRHIQS